MTTTTTIIKRFDTGSINKLDGTNYRVWKMRLTSLFTSYESLGVVTGTESRPPNTAVDAQLIWDQKSREGLTAMLMSMSDDQVEAVSSCTTAQEVWSKLATMYESTSGENKSLIWQQFYQVQTKESPLKAMCEIQSLAAQFTNLGVKVDDEAIVARVLSSMLDERYRQFREAWRSVESKKQKSGLLLSRLKIWELEETQINSLLTSEEPHESKTFRIAPSAKRSKKKSKCRKCGLKGHSENQCTTSDEESTDTEESSDSDSDEMRKYSSLFTKSFVVGSDGNEWYNDSGAKWHLCGKLDMFCEYEEFDVPEREQIADGSFTKVLGYGVVKVEALIRNHWETIKLKNVRYIPGAPSLFSENAMIENGFDVVKNARTRKVVYTKEGIPELTAVMNNSRMQIMNFRPTVNTAAAAGEPLNLVKRTEKLRKCQESGHKNVDTLHKSFWICGGLGKIHKSEKGVKMNTELRHFSSRRDKYMIKEAFQMTENAIKSIPAEKTSGFVEKSQDGQVKFTGPNAREDKNGLETMHVSLENSLTKCTADNYAHADIQSAENYVGASLKRFNMEKCRVKSFMDVDDASQRNFVDTDKLTKSVAALKLVRKAGKSMMNLTMLSIVLIGIVVFAQGGLADNQTNINAEIWSNNPYPVAKGLTKLKVEMHLTSVSGVLPLSNSQDGWTENSIQLYMQNKYEKCEDILPCELEVIKSHKNARIRFGGFIFWILNEWNKQSFNDFKGDSNLIRRLADAAIKGFIALAVVVILNKERKRRNLECCVEQQPHQTTRVDWSTHG